MNWFSKWSEKFSKSSDGQISETESSTEKSANQLQTNDPFAMDQFFASQSVKISEVSTSPSNRSNFMPSQSSATPAKAQEYTPNPFEDIHLPIVSAPALTETPMIWYVDDEPINLVVFENVMESTGYNIRMFSRAEDLLDTIGQEEIIPHVILADIMMPGINGYDLLWVVRKHYDWDTLPIIMLSAKTREEDVSRALDLGANDFLFKPFVKVDFLTRLSMFVKIQSEEE